MYLSESSPSDADNVSSNILNDDSPNSNTRLHLPKPVDSNVFIGVEVKSDEKEYELYYIYP